MFILVAGTSGSGKSLYAERRLSRFQSENKIYIATAKVSDEEMKARVQKHKLMRKDKNFITIECEKNLGRLKIPGNSSALIESLTTWLANEMFDFNLSVSLREPPPLDKGRQPLRQSSFKSEGGKILNDFHKIKSQCENIILVSDYIFSDGVIYDEITEIYIKTLADLMIKFASEADEVIECVSGLTLSYKT